jgi:predicted metalloendopeptidase
VEEKVIPDDKTQITAFNQIDDQMKIDLRIIVNEAINASEIKPFQDLKKLNRACLDLNTIESLGVRPLTDLLLNMGGMPVLGQTISPTWSWTEATKKMREQGFSVNSIFTFGVSIDQQNSTQRIGRVRRQKFINYFFCDKNLTLIDRLIKRAWA